MSEPSNLTTTLPDGRDSVRNAPPDSVPDSAAYGPTLPPVDARGGQIALVADATLGPEAELTAFLCRRVRQVSVLFLCGYTVFLLRELLAPPRQLVHLALAGFAVVLPLQLILVSLMYSRWPESYRRVRTAEWIGLGALWAFLGVNQFLCLANPEATRPLREAASGEMQVLVGNTWLLPWMVLVIGYSVVVPNVWRRALLLAVLTVLVPVVVTLAAVMANPELGWSETKLLFGQYAIWGSVGVWFAVYGAHQSGRLRQQAYEAKRFGQYRILQRLGSGGMGEVYLAEHLLLKRPSVVKVVRPDRARDPAVLSRFEREVQILATLTHWNTVAVFDYGHTTDGTFYYAMEYLPGLDLDELVKQHGPLPAGRVIHLIRQLCAALNEAHAAGLIHRDIKPSNVMVCQRGGVPDVAKLLDFGLVHAEEPAGSTEVKLTTEGTVMGTPHYMSPEQAAGKRTDCRSDVYSLGVTAYFLLCGKPPFHTGRVMEIVAAHMMLPPPALGVQNPDVPNDLEQVVMRCLAKQPGERYASVAALEAALLACCAATAWDQEQAAEWWEKHRQ